MPEVPGLEVLEKVRTFSQVPIILFTAIPDIFKIANGMGANDYILKPISPDFLIVKIKNILGETS